MNLQQFAAWWDNLDDPKFAASITVLTNIKKAVESLCSNTTGACNYEVQTNVNALSTKLDTMATQAKSAMRSSSAHP